MSDVVHPVLYDWPRAAAFGRVIPKNKIYEHAGANTRLKDLFVRDVDQIHWAYKLAPETINLTASKSVTEIQIFRISLKTTNLDLDVLRAIDRAIPFPLFFEVTHGDRLRLAAAYKRQSLNSRGEADSARWVVGDYFTSDWLAQESARTSLPVALNMGALYEQLLKPLIELDAAKVSSGFSESPSAPYTGGQGQDVSIETRIARAEAVKAKSREIERIKTRLAREKQFNKRVAINAELRAAKKELERLTVGVTGAAPIED
ncbi:DUF4391 domain-containing protein [uncultured Roseibium sp.]|uniref:DUF4391 domain-containing protein n=1 Tax=uncultured Roseibium sp. TaxID=1936171 RepID=UPI0026350869|nr:DUF4391 domain-containing protein [uncultured Roseibium sp.]